MTKGARKTTAVSSRSTTRRKLVENEMFEHASRLFAERGFAGTNLGDIAEVMGITRPALYHYVKSKDELLAQLVAQMTEGPSAEIEALVADTGRDPADRLRRIAHLIALQRASQPNCFQLLLRSEADLPPGVAEAHRVAQRNTLHHLIDVIEEGVVKGQFRPVDARTAALAVAGMCNWVAWWFRPDGGPAAQECEAAELLAELAVAMVRQTGVRTPAEPGPEAALALLRQDLDHLARALGEQHRDSSRNF